MTESQKQKMKIGKRISYLERCVTAANLIAEHENNTTIRKRIFALHIKPVLNCSYTAFNSMLNVKNPQNEIAQLKTQLESL